LKRLSPRSKISHSLLAFAGYALLTVLMTYPVVSQLTTRLIGHGNDPYVHYWNNWWVERAWSKGLSPYYTDMLFHPNGASMVYHNFAWLNIVGSLVLKPLTGPVGAYNIVFLLNIALCGLAMYHLAYYTLQNRTAAFVAGLIHAFWPYRMHHTVHPNLISTQWMVWFLLYLIKTVREGKRHHILLAALFLTLTAFARLQLFVLALFPAALYVLYSYFAHREHWNWQTFGRLALVGALTGVMLLYPLFPLIRHQVAGTHPGDVFVDEQSSNQSDLLAYFVPNTAHPLRKEYIPKFFDATVVYVGYTTLALSVYGAIRSRRRGRLWILLAAFSFIMSLGPHLRLGGTVYRSIPLPYQLIGWSFPVRIMRNPHRFNILLAVPMAVLAGWGVKALSASRAHLPALVATGLVLFESLVFPVTTLSLDYSPYYDDLAATSETYGLYDLPMGFSGPAKFYMYLQTIHEKPIVQGKMSRPLRTINDFIDGDPFTKYLRLTKNQIDPDLTAVSQHLDYLADANIRYIVLHRDPQLEDRVPSEEQWAAWQDWLATEPVYMDDRIAVHRTKLQYGRDFSFVRDLGADVGIVQIGEIPDSLMQGNILELELRWGSREPPGEDLKARFALVDQAGVVRQSVKFDPCGDWPTSIWPANAMAIGRYDFQLDPYLPPGLYTLEVELVGEGHAASLATLSVESLPRTYEQPTQLTRSLDVRFGEEIQLLGYDLESGDNTLELTLHWQAAQRPQGYYKTFVHLVDPMTGALVAQHDAVPRNWTYPTNWWETGEVVSDTIPLQISGIPTGEYQITVGMYEPDTGARLPVVGSDENPWDDRLLLWQGDLP